MDTTWEHPRPRHRQAQSQVDKLPDIFPAQFRLISAHGLMGSSWFL